MIMKLAQLVGVPIWAIKIGLALVAGLLLLWAYSAWRDGVIDEYEQDVQSNVSVVTDEAETEADKQLDVAIDDYMARQEQERKEIEDAKSENRSPLDALFD